MNLGNFSVSLAVADLNYGDILHILSLGQALGCTTASSV